MRRVLVSILVPGPLTLSDAAGHHLRDVLRSEAGDAVEAFDAIGNRAPAVVTALRPAVVIQVAAIIAAAPAAAALTVASAVPKGDRADGMVEKLCELGVTAFIPLRTARSVVHPEGAGKLSRWQRIAAEAARQSHRSGVMAIEPLADLPAVLDRFAGALAVFLSTGQGVATLIELTEPPALLLVGPEGGWTEGEEALMRGRGLTPASLGTTILRIETAAVVAAGIARLVRPADTP